MAEQTAQSRRVSPGVVLAIGFAVLVAVRETAFLIWPAVTVRSVSTDRWSAADALSLITMYLPTGDGSMSFSMVVGLISQVGCAVCCLAGAVLLAKRNPLGRTLVLIGAGSRLVVVFVALVFAFTPIGGNRVLGGIGDDASSYLGFFLVWVDWLLPLLAGAFATGRRIRMWVGAA
ncbi:hypothetical protein [Amycolatopsis jejuensis]|uniref:hypothetical protein n=1 Tax=Amycolatopsis jejuensis TaxID=330084 RepID=UPI000524257C|nr:hypothetical protein [Amycolatopsis jejuensis]